jgi:uncharacterized protein (TIRG00374 family)
LKHWGTKFLQYILFPAIGITIVWWLFRGQTLSDIINVLENDINYFWIVFSVVLGILSHVSRAMRWQQLIRATGEHAGFNNSFWAVMTGYFVNLLVPRMGEISKCGVISKYEKISFTKVVGTVVVERLFDILMLLVLFIVVLVLQFEALRSFFVEYVDVDKMNDRLLSPVTWMVIFLFLVGIFILHRARHSLKIFHNLASVWEKFKEGFFSIRNIENVWLFWAYTIFMWIMYFGMIYVAFFSFEDTSHLGVGAGLTILVTGSLGMMLPVQGGLGTWHAMVIATLAIYGVSHDMAAIFALLVHGAQTLMIIVMGLLALIILPLTNRRVNRHEA